MRSTHGFVPLSRLERGIAARSTSYERQARIRDSPIELGSRVSWADPRPVKGREGRVASFEGCMGHLRDGPQFVEPAIWRFPV